MWVTLSNDWLIRSSQDGLVLMTPERNISLDLSDLRLRTKLFRILKGEQKIPEDISEDAGQVIDSLSAHKIIQITEQKPQVGGDTEIGKALWKIRKNVVGSRGPILETFWFDSKQSKLSSVQSQLFMAKYLEVCDKGNNPVISWSFGIDGKDYELAELKAIMEALERYSSGIIPVEELIKTSARKLGKDAVDLHQIIAYTRRQYKNNPTVFPFSKDKEYYWKEVKTFPQNEKKYIPVDCLYYPVNQKLCPNNYTFASSSGVAAGVSMEDAIIRGLYEAIERDAFMMVWINRMRMPIIDKNYLSPEIKSHIRQIEELGYHVRLINTTLDLAPVALATVFSHKNQPALTMGSASNLDISKACLKAITEVEHQFYWDLRQHTKPYSLYDQRKVKNFIDHKALYWTQRHLPRASFLWSGEIQPVKDTDVKKLTHDKELYTLIEILNSRGKKVIIANLTPPFLKKIGVWVIRVIPLGLLPISFGYSNEPLGMRRIKELLGRENLWPHNIPFTHPFA